VLTGYVHPFVAHAGEPSRMVGNVVRVFLCRSET
jgi:hypothetical protein